MSSALTELFPVRSNKTTDSKETKEYGEVTSIQSQIELLVKELLIPKQEKLFQEFLDEARQLINKHSINRTTTDTKENKEYAEIASQSEIEVLAKELLAEKQEKLFREFLSETRQLIEKHAIKTRTCFVCYAWEDENTSIGKKMHGQLQDWLERLSTDLKKEQLTLNWDKESDISEFLHPELYERSKLWLPESWVSGLVAPFKVKKVKETQKWLTKNGRLLDIKISNLEFKGEK